MGLKSDVCVQRYTQEHICCFCLLALRKCNQCELKQISLLSQHESSFSIDYSCYLIISFKIRAKKSTASARISLDMFWYGCLCMSHNASAMKQNKCI